MANDGEVGEVGKRDKLDRAYRNRDGEPTKKITPQVSEVIITVKATGRSVTIPLADLSPDKTLPEPSMLMCAAAFGINTVIGNQVAGATDPEAMIERMTDRAEAIIEGEWSSGREGGPRLSLTLEAWQADLRKRNVPYQESDVAAMRKEIVDGNVSTSDVLSDPDVNAEYQTLVAQRAIERAKAATAKAGASAAPKFMPKSAG